MPGRGRPREEGLLCERSWGFMPCCTIMKDQMPKGKEN